MTDGRRTLSISEAVMRLGQWLDRRLQSGPQNEIERMTPGEVSRTAHDLGISEADLLRLSRFKSDRAQALYMRMALSGVTMQDLVATGLATARDLERTCALCDHHGDCEHDLTERPDSNDWLAQCPNSDVFTKALDALEPTPRRSGG